MKGGLVLALMVLGSSNRAGIAADCSLETNETVCEDTDGCYWQTFEAPNDCRAIPVLDADCTCTLSECSDANTGAAGSGCQPTRFCLAKVGGVDGCGVVNVTSDDDCKEDGLTSCRCVPSEYCTRSKVFDGACSPLMTSIHCFQKSTSFSPTKSPEIVPTREPSIIGLPGGNDDNDGGSNLFEDNIALIGAGASAGGVLILGLGFYFFVKMRKPDEPELRGVISKDQFLELARPAIPKAPEKRQTITKEVIAKEEGMRLMVVFDFEAENEDELHVQAGEEILGLLKYDEWWEAKTADGQVGIIPCNFVDELGLTDGIVDVGNLEYDEDIDF